MPWREEKLKGAAEESAAPSRSDDKNNGDIIRLTLWPNRSIGADGLGNVIWIVFIGFSLPLLALMGSPVAWGLLPFFIIVLLGLYAAFLRSHRDGKLNEVLHVKPRVISIERTEANGEKKFWEANPYWAKPQLHRDAKIESYLTLSGNGRTVELGAFLSPEEREDLYEALSKAIQFIKSNSI